MPNSDKKKINTGSSNISPIPRRISRINPKYSFTSVMGVTSRPSAKSGPGLTRKCRIWGSMNDSQVDTHRDDKIQGASRVSVNQLCIQAGVREGFQHRLVDPGHEILREVHADEGPDAYGIQRVNDALAQLAEVLEKGHGAAGFLRADGVLRVGS